MKRKEEQDGGRKEGNTTGLKAWSFDFKNSIHISSYPAPRTRPGLFLGRKPPRYDTSPNGCRVRAAGKGSKLKRARWHRRIKSPIGLGGFSFAAERKTVGCTEILTCMSHDDVVVVGDVSVGEVLSAHSRSCLSAPWLGQHHFVFVRQVSYGYHASRLRCTTRTGLLLLFHDLQPFCKPAKYPTSIHDRYKGR